MYWMLPIALVLAVTALLWMRKPTLAKMTREAVKVDDPQALVTALSEMPEAARPTAFNLVVRDLWNTYNRGLAARLVRDGAGWLASATIVQYWIKQVLEVEPEVASETFDHDFLTAFYNPEVAARCGKSG
ncbi:MAG: hypothetical protein ACI9OJ_000922 [Myxococcota bacterium]|jgi:hypothetical protein